MSEDISHYRILGRLGRGAMGEVYRAVDQRLGREVALKMLPREVEGDADWQTRLLREAQAASALNHPGIVTLYDIEHHDGRSFLVMELVSGEPLSVVAKNGVTWQRALELVALAADALSAAHALDILHRDIKSDNLMVTTKGQVKVLDFGLAKLRADVIKHTTQMAAVAPPDGEEDEAAPANPVTGDAGLAETIVPRSVPATTSQPSWDRQALRSDLTQAGHLVGTPAYMAPESYDGQTDVRSEVFGLGVVLYELLVGKRPFDRDNSFATMAAIQLDPEVPPSIAAPERNIPVVVDKIVAMALAKAPADRYADMNELGAALRAALAPPAPRAPTRWPWFAVPGVLVVALGAIAVWKLSERAPAAAPPAAPPPPPPKETVKIEVTASRRITLEMGCEEYPRFTPDGSAIVYDGVIEGDYEVLRQSLAGGARQRLTDDSGWDYAEALSPDGKLVAFIHEGVGSRTLRIVDADPAGGKPGTARDLGPIAGYPAWTRDGALLIGDNAGRVVRWELGDSGVANETVVGQLPAGAHAYHVVEVGALGVAVLWWTHGEGVATGLGELSRDGTLRVIEEAATDYEGGMAPSPSGRGYYVTRKSATTGNQLMWRPWGGGDPVVVPEGLSPRAGLDVSRDGTKMVFSTCTDREYIARLRKGGTPETLSRGEWNDTAPFALGGTAVLVRSDRLGQQQGWVIDLAGGESRAVTPPDTHHVSPSHDGKQVAYVAAGGRGGIAIAAIPAAGEATPAPRSLTTDPSDGTPVFSGDGQHVVFVRSQSGGTAKLHVVDLADGTVRALVDGEMPATSRFGDTIAFVTPAAADGARRVMLTDTTGATPRAVPGLEPGSWQRPRFSPDGKKLLLVRGYQEVVEVTLDDSAPEKVLWEAKTDGVLFADYTPDGDGILAGVADYDGDVWLAEGTFP